MAMAYRLRADFALPAVVVIRHRAMGMAQRRRCSDIHSRAFGAFYATRFDSDPFRRDGRRGRLPLRSCARSQQNELERTELKWDRQTEGGTEGKSP